MGEIDAPRPLEFYPADEPSREATPGHLALQQTIDTPDKSNCVGVQRKLEEIDITMVRQTMQAMRATRRPRGIRS